MARIYNSIHNNRFVGRNFSIERGVILCCLSFASISTDIPTFSFIIDIGDTHLPYYNISQQFFYPFVVSCSSYGGSRRPRQSIMKIDNLSELDTTARVHTILASVPNIYTYSCTTQYDDTMHTT